MAVDEIALSFQTTAAADGTAALLCMALVAVLWRQRRRAQNGLLNKASWAVVLPIYEPVLIMLGFAFLVQTALLLIPSRLPAPPSWFVGADDSDSGDGDISASDSSMYFGYWFTFELLSEGFGFLLLHRYPSPSAHASALRYGFLFAVILSAITTIGFNYSLLGLTEETQLIMDTVFLALPCGLYAILVLPTAIATKRLSPLPWAIFSLAWRVTSLVAIQTGAYSSTPLGAVITAARSVLTPIVLYATLVADSHHWRSVGDRAFARIEADAAASAMEAMLIASALGTDAAIAHKAALARRRVKAAERMRSAAAAAAEAAGIPADSSSGAEEEEGALAGGEAELGPSRSRRTSISSRSSRSSRASFSSKGSRGSGTGSRVRRRSRSCGSNGANGRRRSSISAGADFAGQPSSLQSGAGRPVIDVNVASTSGGSYGALAPAISEPSPPSVRGSLKAPLISQAGGSRGSSASLFTRMFGANRGRGGDAPSERSSLLVGTAASSLASVTAPAASAQPSRGGYTGLYSFFGGGVRSGALSTDLGEDGPSSRRESVGSSPPVTLAASLKGSASDLEGGGGYRAAFRARVNTARSEMGEAIDAELDEELIRVPEDGDDVEGGGLQPISAYFLAQTSLDQQQQAFKPSASAVRPGSGAGALGASQSPHQRGVEHVRRFQRTNRRFLVDFSELKIGSFLARGATSDVYSGVLRGSPVAIKMFRPETIDEAAIAHFHKENAIAAALEHSHIVAYHGLCVCPPHISLVFELCSRDSLWTLIDHVATRRRAWQRSAQHSSQPGPPPATLSWRRRLRIARGVASALAYLHSFQPAPFLHRDLKSQNVLITGGYEAKLSDFGESRASARHSGGVGSAPMTGELGTIFWMAPELFRGEEYDESADIYSLGVVLWEILALAHPYEGVPQAHLPMLVAAQRRRPAIPRGSPPAFVRLITACWSDDPLERPSAQAVSDALSAMSWAELQAAEDAAAAAAAAGMATAHSGSTDNRSGQRRPLR